jgi:ribonuclease BN (tRNA processing enzyme)
MKLQFLGTGSAFTPIAENFQSNMIVHSENGKHLLIDCGSDARHALAVLGFTYRDIDGVYISHFHADHAGGLEWLGFSTRFDAKCNKPKLYVHPDVLPRLWTNVMSGGLQSLEGAEPASINDFYELMPITNDSHFSWETLDFQLIKTIHAFNGRELLPSYGIYFSSPKTQVFITTDTQFKPELYMSYFEQADIIFHDCDTGKTQSPVHSHFLQLATLPSEIKAKMWLYHYSSADQLDAVAHGFRGFVVKGQEFEI